MISNHSYNDIIQVWKEQLHHIQNLKIDSSAKHNKKNDQNHNNNASEMNDKNAQHAIKTADEKASKLFYRNNIRSAD